MADKRVKLALVQVCATGTELFGLDEDGRVWVYKPRTKAITGTKERHAFWTQITNKASKWVPDKPEGG